MKGAHLSVYVETAAGCGSLHIDCGLAQVAPGQISP